MKILIDTHTHSIASIHAYSTITENFSAAKEKNMTAVAITDHSYHMPGCHHFHFVNLNVLPKNLFGVRLYKGVELNILDIAGNVDDGSDINFPRLFSSLELKIASLHPPCITLNSKDEVTKCICNTINKNNFDIIGHLGDPRYPFHIDEVIKFATEHNIAIEINNSSLNPDSMRYDETTILKIIESCVKYNSKIVFGSDAHFHTDIGNFTNIEAMFEKYKIDYDQVLSTSLEKLDAHLIANRR